MLIISDQKAERNLPPNVDNWIKESWSWGNLSFLKRLLVECWLLSYLLSISLVLSDLSYIDHKMLTLVEIDKSIVFIITTQQ